MASLSEDYFSLNTLSITKKDAIVAEFNLKMNQKFKIKKQKWK